jgi:hypothetical protein
MSAYTPKLHDLVLIEGHTWTFVIVGVDVPRMTADVRSTLTEGLLLRDVPWAKISDFRAGQCNCG